MLYCHRQVAQKDARTTDGHTQYVPGEPYPRSAASSGVGTGQDSVCCGTTCLRIWSSSVRAASFLRAAEPTGCCSPHSSANCVAITIPTAAHPH